MLKYYSSIRVLSKSLNAEEIENILNIKFDEKREIGQPRTIKTILKFNENIWILKSNTDANLPLENHIESLFDKIGPEIKRFSQLEENDCRVVCQCIIEGNSEEDGYPEINFSPNLIKKLSIINASIDVDLYI
jgi:hypothetical protein